MTNISTQLENELLARIGLDEREIKIYLALLREGAMLPQHIARKTGIRRTTLYEVFPEMIGKGIIKEIKQGKRRFFQVVPPNILFNNYEQNYKEIKQGIVDLMSLYSLQGLKPNVEIYEGIEGIKKIYLDTIKEGKEVRVYNRMYRYDKTLLEWINKVFIPQRIKNNIRVRAIVTAEEAGFENMADQGKYRETRFVPYEKFPLRIETFIYANKIVFSTVEEKGPLVGVVVESKQIVQAQKALFDLAWEGAQHYALPKMDHEINEPRTTPTHARVKSSSSRKSIKLRGRA